jgi:hypothetical protein
MKIWIIKVGEQHTIDGEEVRLQRSGLLAKGLSQQGMSVSLFIDKFNHWRKKERKLTPSEYAGVNYKYLRGVSYSSNDSILRLVNHFQIAIDFKRQSKLFNKPNFIIISYPTIILAFFAACYAKKNKIPYIVDFRDAWPDIFFENRFIKALIKLIYFHIIRFIIKNSNQLTGCAPYFEKFSQYYFEGKKFTYIPHTYIPKLDIRVNSLAHPTKSIVYFGAVSKQREINQFLGSFIKYKYNSQIKFYICGDGPELSSLKNKFKDYSNIIFTGYIDFERISFLASQAILGVAPYRLHEGYVENIPNKIIEYLFWGLGVITNIDVLRINNGLELPNNANKFILNYQSESDLFFIFDKIHNWEIKKTDIRKVFDSNFSYETFLNSFKYIIECNSLNKTT